MTRRYLMVLIFGIVAGLALIVVSRRAPAPDGPVVEETAPASPLLVRVLDQRVEVSDSVMAQGVSVRLTVKNESSHPVMLTLGGYEDRVRFEALPPGASDTTSFVADRPGERFPWLRDGIPAARLEVTGSHLVEDHR